ncbi:uncharacterized protein LOC119372614 [Rhipicephalus sanguineus]|uniref:uncharacterized protein LOC119372614 n=1 Tax=Rhipicephalus sanguineus TaxID=34632 RepID=UPI001895B6E7|nr:uncharacterized protein LOC119372614 [Rhipicephalus sanguineus]
MKTGFVLCLCIGFVCLVAADEAEDVAKLIEETIRENAGSDALAEKILARVKILQDCAAEHKEEGIELLKKYTVPITKEGTQCAATKSGIADAAERDIAEHQCFREASKRFKESTPPTEKENATYEAMKACFLPKLAALEASSAA